MSDSKTMNKPINTCKQESIRVNAQHSSRLSMRAGVLNHDYKKDFQAFRNDLAATRDEIKEHIKNEEIHVHPFLRERVPGAARISKTTTGIQNRCLTNS